MAKKHSSKTATEKAIQSSEPRVLSWRGWKGVNFADAPLTWQPLETGLSDYRETDLPDNYFMVQNNLETTITSGVQTRHDSIPIMKIEDAEMGNCKFTGVANMYKRWLFCAVHDNDANNDFIYCHDITKDDREYMYRIDLYDYGAMWEGDRPKKYDITDINFYEGYIVVMARENEYVDSKRQGHVFLGTLDESDPEVLKVYYQPFDQADNVYNMVSCNQELPTPRGLVNNWNNSDGTPIVNSCELVAKGSLSMLKDNRDGAHPRRLEVCYCYTTRLGATLVSDPCTIYVNEGPEVWNSGMYLEIRSLNDTIVNAGIGCNGIDLYAREKENVNWGFIGHITIPYTYTSNQWTYNWLGNMTDISQWMTSSLANPKQNDTAGTNSWYMSIYDSRIYYWGSDDKPYRLNVGGDPGAEFSTARGLGGAWVDIEPGSGYDIKGIAKWKTNSGANIITILCGNKNTNKVKRFNLIETSLTVTNEISYKEYMYEDVSNVVGCNSRYGFGVFADGLYTLGRYGLMVTTMAMEYNNQMRSNVVSGLISPVFTDRLGKMLDNGNLVYINGIIYIAVGDPTKYDGNDPVGLGQVIFCYDIDLQSWYTFTHDLTLNCEMGDDPDVIKRILAIDSEDYQEGLGVITDHHVILYPITGAIEPTVPDFQVILETGELIPRMPMQAFNYIQQLEFRFDYLITDPDEPTIILVEGTDYYGRMFTITKKISIENRHPFDTDEPRNYVEWIRVDKLVESMRIRIKGKARFRLTHINCKLYQQADVIGTPYGFNAHDQYKSRHGEVQTQIHHYIDSYNNLRRAIVT